MRLFFFLLCGIIIGISVGVGSVIFWQKTQTPNPIFIPDPTPTPEPERPLLKYTFEQLRQTTIDPAPLTLTTEEIFSDNEYRVLTFTAKPLGRTMSGVVNLPTTVSASASAVLMLRGFVPANQYAPGVGTKNAAAALARAGFVTIAPDFFGYGESEPEPTDEWQARFEKPLVALALLSGLKTSGFQLPDGSTYQPQTIGIWGHSNGGQIALSALAISQERVPASLWAPVTAPFPYSILYFTDEEADEGQASRKWISIFEKLYDARQFSFTNYLDGLRGPVQIQQGTNDDAVLKWWSDEFVQKLKNENTRREKVKKALMLVDSSTATHTADLKPEFPATPAAHLEPIAIEYQLYQGADHNMRPNWDEAIAKDIVFFKREL